LIGGVIVSVLISSAVDRGVYGLRSSQAKAYTIGICSFSAKHDIQLLPLTAHVDTFELGQQINKLKIKKTFSWKYVKAEHISKIKTKNRKKCAKIHDRLTGIKHP
jgi:hypothetical protein